MSAVMRNAAMRSAQIAYDNACPDDASRADQADEDVRTDTDAMRECVIAAQSGEAVELATDALLALRDAEAAGVFTALKLRQPLNVIQTEALARLGREARQWHGNVEEEINNEVSRRVAA